jgi:hypothetical protein
MQLCLLQGELAEIMENDFITTQEKITREKNINRYKDKIKISSINYQSSLSGKNPTSLNRSPFPLPKE